MLLDLLSLPPELPCAVDVDKNATKSFPSFSPAQFFSCLINTFCRVKLRVVRSGVKPYSLIINFCHVIIRSYLGNLIININLLLHGNSFPLGCGFAAVDL